jgi:diguanylate cyclase (GGDEF)-like protein
MLFPETQAEEALVILEEFRKKVETCEFEYDGQKLMLTVSIGVAQAGLHSKDGRVLFNMADDAMYECKRNGRNQTRIAKIPTEKVATGDGEKAAG